VSRKHFDVLLCSIELILGGIVVGIVAEGSSSQVIIDECEVIGS
jgi:hypothetical protein